MLAYTDADVAAPLTWIESDPKLIANPQMVKLHSFDTKVDDDAAKDPPLCYQLIFDGILQCGFFLVGADSQGEYTSFIQE